MYNMAEYERQVYLHLEVYLPFYPTKSFKRPRRFGKTLNMSMLRYFFELKYAKLFSVMAKACESAMTQIHQRRYDDYLRNDGREKVLAYGIAFCKKRCKVVTERMK